LLQVVAVVETKMLQTKEQAAAVQVDFVQQSQQLVAVEV
jgi:hypothetical protein